MLMLLVLLLIERLAVLRALLTVAMVAGDNTEILLMLIEIEAVFCDLWVEIRTELAVILADTRVRALDWVTMRSELVEKLEEIVLLLVLMLKMLMLMDEVFKLIELLLVLMLLVLLLMDEFCTTSVLALVLIDEA